jgi:hypothetical protein
MANQLFSVLETFSSRRPMNPLSRLFFHKKYPPLDHLDMVFIAGQHEKKSHILRVPFRGNKDNAIQINGSLNSGIIDCQL